MSKAIIEFDLSDPDDIIAHKRATKSLDLCLSIWDIEQYLRSKLKHESLSSTEYTFLEKIQEDFYNILDKYHVNLDELII